MNFHAKSFEWLSVNEDSSSAQIKGSGTINGSVDSNGIPFKFMLWVEDGSQDTIRIHIWQEDANGEEHDIYDNGFNQSIGGGNIVIHKTK